VTRIRALASTLLVAVVLIGLLPFTPPATAASTYLCTSYVGCKQAGYPHFGYKKAGRQMWWRMYSGHNCTNYVAYRLVKGGMSPERPWSGSGNATNWGRAKKNITDKTPMVGAVAWWAAGDGVGSAGHVAFVEQVVDNRTIVISEDSWGGDFHWRRIERSSSSWPTGFIHFNDRAVRNTAVPAISGTPAVGTPLTATTGTWTPAATYTFQWLADGKAIAGATTATFTPTVDLLGKQLTVRVGATRRGYVAATASSVASAPVAKGTLDTTTTPAVSGAARVDEVLSVRPGAWSPAPATTVTRWYADGQLISSATGKASLRLDETLFKQVITVRVTARREGYKASTVASAPTAPVAAGVIELTAPYTLGGASKLGGRLAVADGKADPGDAAVTYTWLRDGQPVAGATTASYDLRAGDVGARMSVQVRLRRTGYLTKTMTLATAGVVTTVPTLKVTATGKRKRAVVALRVTAPGVAAPSGNATVTVGGQAVTGRVVGGRLRVVVTGVRSGTRTVRVAYAGTEAILPRSARTTVSVLR
jgi:surface antigen